MDIESKLQLWDTLSKQKKEFLSIKKGEVSFYLCGPTVYDHATIGNFRTYILGDIINRVLTYNNYTVTYVQNITDVGHMTDEENDLGEDKMEKGAKKTGSSAWETARLFTKLYFEDSDKLNIKRPTISCAATDHIDLQLELVKKLEDGGFTYQTSDGIYFDTTKQKDYGKLARLDIAGLREGARVSINKEKKSATDFALWKFSPKDKKRQMEWESPWGRGFPGWHLECSAMSIKYLGQPFDIHGGGIDLIPIHHTNEIAQNEALYGHKTVNYWLHGGFILINGLRMGKSIGNAYGVNDLIKKGFDPLSFRYLTFTAHYRQPLNFTWEALEQAQVSYRKIIRMIAEMSPRTIEDSSTEVSQHFNQKFLETINDDLNMPQAIASVWEMLKDKNLAVQTKLNTLYKFDEVLGLSIKEKVEELKKEVKNIPKEVAILLKKRGLARKDKNWKEADKIKKDIIDKGFKIRDQGEETTISAG